MSETRPLPRTALSPQERRCRSRLTALVAGQPFLKGTLLERQRVCGKPNCRCTRGQKHRGLYLVLSQGKQVRQLYVPKAWEGPVRQWVANHHQIRQLVAEVSELYWQKVRQRQA